MKIDDERLRAWGDALPIVPCPWCQGVERRIKTEAAALVNYDVSGAAKLGAFPVVIVECKTCARIDLFSAVALGLHLPPPRLIKPESE
jgi:hypothetical protein